MIPTRSIICLSALLAATPGRPAAPTSLPRASASFSTRDACDQTARQLRRARRHDVLDDYYEQLAICENITDPEEMDACLEEAVEARKEGLEEANEQFDARVELCESLGGGAYDPVIDPANFVSGVDNTYFPLVPGTVRTYQEQLAGGGLGETVVITVLEDTKEILGVACTVVRDTVTIDGEIEEDTLDYFAQDITGTVWYFGELSMSFEDGELASLDGSFQAGRDGAKPGIVMLAGPLGGETYRQEFFVGEAEDAGTVLSISATADVPFGSFIDCVQTRDFSPLEPDHEENKFYAAGIGPVLEVNLVSGDRLELISVTGR